MATLALSPQMISAAASSTEPEAEVPDLPQDIMWFELVQRALSLRDVWALTATCKAAHAQRTQATAGRWLRRHKPDALIHLVYSRKPPLPGAVAELLAADASSTPLHVASASGDAALVSTLLGKRANSVHAVNSARMTPLHLAAYGGHEGVIEALTAAGADVNAATATGATPLYLAVNHGQADAVRALLRAGADAKTKYKPHNKTLFHLAGRAGHAATIPIIHAVRCVNVNLPDGLGLGALHLAACYGHADAVDELLKAGSFVNSVYANGRTALHSAAREGHVDVIRVLAAAGARLDEGDDWNHTPLHVAAERGQTAAVEALLEAGANVKALARNDTTALGMAAANGHAGIVRLLAGAVFNDGASDAGAAAEAAHDAHGVYGAQAGDAGRAHHGGEAGRASELGRHLHAAAEGGHVSVIQVLAELGADVDMRRDTDGMTPLHAAAKWGSVCVVKALVAAGADLHAVDGAGRTPLDVARRYCAMVAGVLLQLGDH